MDYFGIIEQTLKTRVSQKYKKYIGKGERQRETNTITKSIYTQNDMGQFSTLFSALSSKNSQKGKLTVLLS